MFPLRGLDGGSAVAFVSLGGGRGALIMIGSTNKFRPLAVDVRFDSSSVHNSNNRQSINQSPPFKISLCCLSNRTTTTPLFLSKQITSCDMSTKNERALRSVSQIFQRIFQKSSHTRISSARDSTSLPRYLVDPL